MKTLFRMKKLLPLVLAGLSVNTMATDFTASLEFETLAEIQINTVRDISFGPVLSLTQAATCDMDPSGGGTEILSDNQLGTTTHPSYTSSGELSASCGNPSLNGTVGIYEIESYSGAAITVDLNAGTATAISFDPRGFVVDHNTNDIVNVTVATDASAEATDTLTAQSVVGRNIIVIGGEITNLQPLVADGTYNTDFELIVTYQ